MFKKPKFKSFDKLPLPACVIDEHRKIVYTNSKCMSIVHYIAPNDLIENPGLILAIENSEQFIYDKFLICVQHDSNQYILTFQDIEHIIDKLHKIRHDIKNHINPLAMLSGLGVDNAGMVDAVNKAVNKLQPKDILIEK